MPAGKPRAAAAAILMGPLLLAQGLWVRRVTPKLPEAPGAREGVRAPAVATVATVATAATAATGSAEAVRSGAALRLLIVGDSSAAGVGAAHQDEALAGRLSAALVAALATTVHWRLVARTGVTARELAKLIDEAAPARFDIALIVVGVNDVTGLRSKAAWLRDVDALAARLRNIAPGARLVASGLPPMHLFPALPQPLRGFLGARAIAFDDALGHWAARQPDALHVPIPEMADPSLAASDGFHPGPGAYALWAAELALAIARDGALRGRGRAPTNA
jgi:lysophospholipase L1-like esterase